MRQRNYLLHLLFWLAFIVAVRIAMMLWTDWLAALVLLPLPFYLLRGRLLRYLQQNGGPIYKWIRYLQLLGRQHSREKADESDTLPHMPQGFCPKCGYRVDVGRCPECGNDITPENIRAVPSGFLRRNRRSIIVGCCLVVLCSGGYAFFTQVDWLARLSFENILRLHDWGYGGAEKEIERRFVNRGITKSELKTLLERIVEPRLSIPTPYPHDARVPCDLQIPITVSFINAGTYCYIRNWICELDGHAIEQTFSPDVPREACHHKVLFTLPPTEPGPHTVRVRGDVLISAAPDPKLLPQTTIYDTPFLVEFEFVSDEATAYEMIAATFDPLVADAPDICPIAAVSRRRSALTPRQNNEKEGQFLDIGSDGQYELTADVAGRVLVRPKGMGDFIDVGGCYISGRLTAHFSLEPYDRLKRAKELDILIEPDAREAAYRSRMECELLYAEPLELTATKKKEKRNRRFFFF